MLIGNTVYRKSAIIHSLKIGYQYVHTCAAHVAIAIDSLKKGRGLFLCDQIIESMIPKPDNAEVHALLDYWIGVSSLSIIMQSSIAEKNLNKKIAGIGCPGQPVWWLLYSVVKSVYSGQEKKYIIGRYKRVIYCTYYRTSFLRFAAFYYIPSIILLVPYGETFLRIFGRIKKMFIAKYY